MTEPTNEPAACALPEEEYRARRADVLTGLARKITAVDELDDGYRLRFPYTASLIEELAKFIIRERECCGFFRFTLEVESNGGPVWLALTGPAEAKKMIGSFLAAAGRTR